MRKVKYAVLGYGGRGVGFASYSLACPQDAEVVAVIDLNPFLLEVAKNPLSLRKPHHRLNLNSFLLLLIKTDLNL